VIALARFAASLVAAAGGRYQFRADQRRRRGGQHRSTGGADMKAVLDGREVAASDDIVSVGGYEYFPPSAVRLEWLAKSPRTPHDLECPHGVQFYDVVIEGVRHVRNAWSYESPQPKMEPVRDRFGFWEDVEVR
jgi:uncharacterized protein (DUF427 family)